jgi:hypothetical protein
MKRDISYSCVTARARGRALPWALVLAAAGLWPAAAGAQTAAGATPAAPPAASAARDGKATPPNAPTRPTAAQAQERAVMPGDLRPEHPVVPQVSIPFGRTPPPPAAPKTGTGKAPAGGIDDSVARCEAQAASAARKMCRDRLRSDKRPAPGG